MPSEYRSAHAERVAVSGRCARTQRHKPLPVQHLASELKSQLGVMRWLTVLRDQNCSTPVRSSYLAQPSRISGLM